MLTPGYRPDSKPRTTTRPRLSPVALRRQAIDIAVGLDVQGAPAVAAIVLVEVARRDAGGGMSDAAFKGWLGAIAHIRPTCSLVQGQA